MHARHAILLALAACAIPVDDPPIRQPGSVLHKECSQAFESEDHPEPLVPTDARGRPHFAFFADLACEDTLSTCEAPGDDPSCAECLSVGTGATGLCLADEEATSDATVIVTNGACLGVVALQFKQDACCNPRLRGVDCRTWPYPRKSAPGELCVRHADCAPGLVCEAIDLQGADAGMCRCPERTGTPFTQPSSCRRAP